MHRFEPRIVYGIKTKETEIDKELVTSFHYDSIFGTVINRFITQLATDTPLTVYGNGSQKRGFLNIIDTIECINIAAMNPPKAVNLEYLINLQILHP